MAIPVGSFLDEQSQAIEEVLARDTELLLPTHDPFFSKIVQMPAESGGNGNGGPWGRDLRVRKTWYTGYTGVIDQGTSRQDFALYGDTAGASSNAFSHKLFTQQNENTFPDPLLGKSQRPIRLTIGLRSSVTNLYWSMGELQAEATAAYIASDLSLKMKGFANNIAHVNANYLWLSQNDNYRLMDIPPASEHDILDDDFQGSSGPILAIEPANLTCDRLHPGMRVNLVAAASAGSGATGVTKDEIRKSGGGSATSQGSETELIVVNVDPLVNKVYLRWGDGTAWTLGSGGSGNNFSVGDYLVFPGSNDGTDYKGYAGLNSWLKTGTETGTDGTKLLGNEAQEFGGTDGTIDVLQHPEFRSGKWDFKNRPLTERRLRQILRRFHMAHGKYGHTCDSLFMSDGVAMAYERQWSGKEYIDRTGNLANVMKGQGMKTDDAYSSFKFTMDGEEVCGYTCRNIDANTVYGTKTKNGNWKMYTPPDYPGLQKDSQVGGKYAAFRFIGGVQQGSIKFPVLNTGGTRSLITEGMQTPGIIRQQLVPDQIPGIKLTNVEEDRSYADTV